MNKHLKTLDRLKSSGKKICIVGAGGFGRETLCCLIDIIAGTEMKIEDVACFMVTDNKVKVNTLMGVPVIPFTSFDPEKYDVVVAIGDSITRKAVVESLPSETYFATLIHPTAVMSDWNTIGEGSIITAGVIITCNVTIGKHAHLNLYTTIGHDCEAGEYFTTAPSCNISGACKFGDGVFIGTNASIKQGVEICNNVTIGMGGVVVKNITEEGTYIGMPVKKIKVPEIIISTI